MYDVIIPAKNEQMTIYNVVQAFRECKRIVNVIVMVDDKTNDSTRVEAQEAGAETIRLNGISGKGQLIAWALVGRQEQERIILSDGDYTRINANVVNMVTSPQVVGMRVIVPRFPSEAQWKASGFPFPFDQNAWAVNSGLRNVPVKIAQSQLLHGYLAETQLNKEARRQGIPIELVQMNSLIAPLRFTDERLQAMEEDRRWGLTQGVFDV